MKACSRVDVPLIDSGADELSMILAQTMTGSPLYGSGPFS